MTVNELKDQARARGLKVSGTKAELLARLQGGASPTPSPKAAPVVAKIPVIPKITPPAGVARVPLTGKVTPATLPPPGKPALPAIIPVAVPKNRGKVGAPVTTVQATLPVAVPKNRGKVAAPAAPAQEAEEVYFSEDALKNMTVAKLKELMKERDIKPEGAKVKADFIARLMGHQITAAAKPGEGTPVKVLQPPTTLVAGVVAPAKTTGIDFNKMTVSQLKDELRARKMALSGNKADLVARLQGGDVVVPAGKSPIQSVLGRGNLRGFYFSGPIKAGEEDSDDEDDEDEEDEDSDEESDTEEDDDEGTDDEESDAEEAGDDDENGCEGPDCEGEGEDEEDEDEEEEDEDEEDDE